MENQFEKATIGDKIAQFVTSVRGILIAVVAVLVVVVAAYGICSTLVTKSSQKALADIDSISYNLTKDSAALSDEELEARKVSALAALEPYTAKNGVAGVRADMLAAEILFSQIEQFEDFVRDEAEKYRQKSVIYIDELPLVSVFSADIMYLDAQLNITLETWIDTDNGFHSAESNVCFCFRPVNLENNTYIPVVKEHPIVVVNKEHPLASKSEIHIKDILSEGLVLSRFRHSTYISQLLKAYGAYNAYPIHAYEATEVRTLLDMVRAGVGIKISPSYILRVFRMDGLKVLPLIADELFIEYGFLVRDMEKLKPTERQFIEAMLDEHNTPWQIIRE